MPASHQHKLRVRQWLHALLLGALLFAQTAAAGHDHALQDQSFDDCEVCLQLHSGGAAVDNSVAARAAPTTAIQSSSLRPSAAVAPRYGAPRSRAPPAY